MNGSDITGVVGYMLARRSGAPAGVQNAALVRGLVKDKTAALVLDQRAYNEIGQIAKDRDALQLRVAELEAKPRALIPGITGGAATATGSASAPARFGLDLDKILKIEHVIYYGLWIVTLLIGAYSVGGQGESLFNKIGAGIRGFRDAVGNVISGASGGAKPTKKQLDALSVALNNLSEMIKSLATAIESIPAESETDGGAEDGPEEEEPDT